MRRICENSVQNLKAVCAEFSFFLCRILTTLVVVNAGRVLCGRRVRRPSHRPRYLHSAALLGRLMLVFGGNTHNDTSAGRVTKCYSSGFMAYDLGTSRLPALEMCGNGLQHSHCLPFPSVHSHSQSHSHHAYDLIPIPVPLPNFLPIPSHSHSRLTNEWHLSLNNETMISTELYGSMSQGTNVTVSYWLAFALSQPIGILAHMKK